MGAAFTGRSAAIAEPAKPAVIAIDARSFFIVHSARFVGPAWVGVPRVHAAICGAFNCAQDIPEACKGLSPARHNRGEVGRREIYLTLSLGGKYRNYKDLLAPSQTGDVALKLHPKQF